MEGEIKERRLLHLSCESIDFGVVAVNEIPSYRQLRLKNIDSKCGITVFISSSSQIINIQKCNENFEMLQKGSSSLLRSYNALFDTVGTVSSLTLQPGEEVELIAWFFADSSTFAHLVAKDAPVKASPSFQFSYRLDEDNEDYLRTMPEKAVENFTINCSAMVFLSQLEISTTLLQCTIAPNKTQLMNFSVTNMSTEPLSFMIRNISLQIKGVSFGVYDSNNFDDPKIGHRIRLDTKASVSLCLLVQADNNAVPSHYQATLQCDNIRDSRNSIQLQVSINVSSDFDGGDIVSFSSNKIDFGDVYRGIPNIAEVDLINIDNREDIALRLLDDELMTQHLGEELGEHSPIRLLKDDGQATEELVISSQRQKTRIRLQYKPSMKTDLSEIKFNLNFSVTTASNRYQRLRINCQAKLFTSSIKVSQRDINIGDCIVGQSKKITFYMENFSPLPGCCTVELRSKILSIEGRQSREGSPRKREIRESFTIAPMSKMPITLRISPQRVNPTYRKEITIFNTSNPTADRQIINVEANNMAPSDAKAHNELYGWECCLEGYDSETSALARIRGEQTKLCAITGVPLIIPYLARSKVDTPLELQVESTCDEITVFCLNDPAKADQVESLASQLRGYCAYDESEEGNKGNKSSASAPENLQTIIDELQHIVVKHGKERKSFKLEGLSVQKLFVKICRTTHFNEIFTKEDGLSIAVEGADIPSRFVRLSYRLCGTQFHVCGQLVKNFGEVNIGTKRPTKISVVNRCRSVLYIRVSKSHSATAGHIRIANSEKQEIALMVRPYASKEIELTFSPGIKGNFEEKIHLSNILCPPNTFTMTLKASVVKADTFEVSPDSWNFEPFEVPFMGDPPYRTGARFTASNTSKTTRQICLRFFQSCNGGGGSEPTSARIAPSHEGGEDNKGEEMDLTSLNSSTDMVFRFQGVAMELQLIMEPIGASSGSSRRIEEEIEKLDQKIKIYKRKNKTEKLAAATERRATLQRQLTGGDLVDFAEPEALDSEYAMSESEDEHGQNTDMPRANTLTYSHAELLPLLLRDGVSLPVLQAGESASVLLRFSCTRMPGKTLPELQRKTLHFVFYEELDTEVCRIVPVSLTIQRQGAESGSPSRLAAKEEESTRSGTPSTRVTAPSNLVVSLRDFTSPSTSTGPLRLPCSSTLTFMDHPLLVLRNCVVNEAADFSFLLTTTGSATTFVVLESRPCRRPLGGLEAKFNVRPHSGELQVGSSVKLEVTCTPQRAGPQKYFIPIMNAQQSSSSQDMKYLVVAMNPTPEEDPISIDPAKLVFPPVITPVFPVLKGGVNDSGAVRSGLGSRPVPQELCIRTRFPCSHLLRVRTNRPAQVHLFEDRQCTVPLENLLVRFFCMDVVRVYVVFTPSPKAMHTVPTTFRGGIVIEALSASERDSAPMQVVSSVVAEVVCEAVGSGWIVPSTTAIPLGAVRSTTTEIRTHLALRNPSPRFPIEVELQTPPSRLLEVGDTPTLMLHQCSEEETENTRTAHSGGRGRGCQKRDERGGEVGRAVSFPNGKTSSLSNGNNTGELPRLHNKEGGSCVWELPPLSEVTFCLFLRLPSVGLWEETLVVRNLSCAQPSIAIPLSALRQDPCVSAPLLSLGGLTLPPAVVVWQEEEEEEENSDANAGGEGPHPPGRVPRGKEHHMRGFQLFQPVSTTVAIQNTGKKEAVLVAELDPKRHVPLWFGDVPSVAPGVFRTSSSGSLAPHHSTPGGRHFSGVMSPTRVSPSGGGFPSNSAHPTGTSFPSSPLKSSGVSSPRARTTSGVERASRHPFHFVTVSPKSTTHISWTLTDLPTLTPDEAEALHRHQAVRITVIAKIHLATSGGAGLDPLLAALTPYPLQSGPGSDHSRSSNPTPNPPPLPTTLPAASSARSGRSRRTGGRATHALPSGGPPSNASLLDLTGNSEAEAEESRLGSASASPRPAGLHRAVCHPTGVLAGRVGCTSPAMGPLGPCVAVVPLTVTLALSEGRALASAVELGVVTEKSSVVSRDVISPHQTALRGDRRQEEPTPRRRVAVRFQLENLSSHLPLPLTVQCPPVIRFAMAHWSVPPGSRLEVEGYLQLAQLDTEGAFSYPVYFVNALNPGNDICVRVSGQYYRKLFDLECGGVDVGESLELPTLRVDPSSSTPAILAEVKLAVRTTDPETVLQVSLRSNERSQGLMELQLVHYDDTTTAVETIAFKGEKPLEILAAPTNPAVEGEGGDAAGEGGAEKADTRNDGVGRSGAAGTGPKRHHHGRRGAENSSGNNGDNNNNNNNSNNLVTGTTATTSGSTNNSFSNSAEGCGSGATNHPNSHSENSHHLHHTNVSTSSGPRYQYRKLVRLRCVLLDGQRLDTVLDSFVRRREDSEARMQRWSLEDTVHHSEMHRKFTEIPIEKLWLGSLVFHNAWTEDVEVHLTSTIEPFVTFSASPKLLLQPKRPPAADRYRRGAAKRSGGQDTSSLAGLSSLVRTAASFLCGAVVAELNPSSSGAATAVVASSEHVAEEEEAGARHVRPLTPLLLRNIEFVGNILVSNTCERYTTELRLVALLREESGGAVVGGGAGGSHPPLFLEASTTSATPADTAGGTTSSEVVVRHALLRSNWVSGGAGGSESVQGLSTVSPVSPPPAAFPIVARSSHCNAIFSGTGNGEDPHSQPLPCTSGGALGIIDFFVPPNTQQTLKIRLLPLPALLPWGLRHTGGRSSAAPTDLTPPQFSVTALTNWLERSLVFVVMDKRVACSLTVCGINVAPLAEEEEEEEDHHHAVEEQLHSGGAESSSSNHQHRPKEDEAGAAANALSAEEKECRERVMATPSALELATESAEGSTAVTAALRGDAATAVVKRSFGNEANSATAVEPSSAGGAGATTTTGALLPLPDRPILTLRHCQPVLGMPLSNTAWSCGTAFQAKFIFSKAEPQTPEMTMRNTLQDREVRYHISVLSQSPRPWFLVTAPGGVLQPGESKPLGLHLGPTEVGSFEGYLQITNSVRPAEVVYLRLKAEAFEKTPREDLFELLASDGSSLTYHSRHATYSSGTVARSGGGADGGAVGPTTNSGVAGVAGEGVGGLSAGPTGGPSSASTSGGAGGRSGGTTGPQVELGHLYGEGATQAYVAMEIVNKSAVALEFPISVVMPFHLEVKRSPPEEEACGAWHRRWAAEERRRTRRKQRAAAKKEPRHPSESASAGAEETQRGAVDGPSKKKKEAEGPRRGSIQAPHQDPSAGLSPEAFVGSRSGFSGRSDVSSLTPTQRIGPSEPWGVQPLSMTSHVRSEDEGGEEGRRHGGVMLEGKGAAAEQQQLPFPSRGPARGAPWADLSTSQHPLPLSSAEDLASSLLLPPFEGTLITCHLHAVQARIGQKYIVVDPQSRVRLAVVLQTTHLRLPTSTHGAESYLVEGSADVMVHCKQVRDSQVTLRVHFFAAPATFEVPSVVEIPYEHTHHFHVGAEEEEEEALDEKDYPIGGTKLLAGTAGEPPGPLLETSEVRGTTRMDSPGSFGFHHPHRLQEPDHGMSMVRLSVRNLRCSAEQYIFHTQSPVLHVEPAEEEEREALTESSPVLGKSTDVFLGTSTAGSPASGHHRARRRGRRGGETFVLPRRLEPGKPFHHTCTMEVRGNSTGYFYVWLDREKAASLLRCDERGLPALVEHASVRRVYNPTERIHVEFCLQPPRAMVGGRSPHPRFSSPGSRAPSKPPPHGNAQPTPTPSSLLRRGHEKGGVSSPPPPSTTGERNQRLVDPSFAARTVSQQVNDACLMSFAIEFTSTLRRYHHRLVHWFKWYAHWHLAGEGEGAESVAGGAAVRSGGVGAGRRPAGEATHPSSPPGRLPLPPSSSSLRSPHPSSLLYTEEDASEESSTRTEDDEDRRCTPSRPRVRRATAHGRHSTTTEEDVTSLQRRRGPRPRRDGGPTSGGGLLPEEWRGDRNRAGQEELQRSAEPPQDVTKPRSEGCATPTGRKSSPPNEEDSSSPESGRRRKSTTTAWGCLEGGGDGVAGHISHRSGEDSTFASSSYSSCCSTCRSSIAHDVAGEKNAGRAARGEDEERDRRRGRHQSRSGSTMDEDRFGSSSISACVSGSSFTWSSSRSGSRERSEEDDATGLSRNEDLETHAHRHHQRGPCRQHHRVSNLSSSVPSSGEHGTTTASHRRRRSDAAKKNAPLLSPPLSNAAAPLDSFEAGPQRTETSHPPDHPVSHPPHRHHHHRRRALLLSSAAWRQLHHLLVELTWIVEELLRFTILLRNSRHVESCCVFITSVVAEHPTVRVWRRVFMETQGGRVAASAPDGGGGVPSSGAAETSAGGIAAQRRETSASVDGLASLPRGPRSRSSGEGMRDEGGSSRYDTTENEDGPLREEGRQHRQRRRTRREGGFTRAALSHTNEGRKDRPAPQRAAFSQGSGRRPGAWTRWSAAAPVAPEKERRRNSRRGDFGAGETTTSEEDEETALTSEVVASWKFHLFQKYLEAISALPCPTPSMQRLK